MANAHCDSVGPTPAPPIGAREALNNKGSRLSLCILIDNINRPKGDELPGPLQYLLCPFVG